MKTLFQSLIILSSVLFVLLSGCENPPKQTQTSTNPEVPITGKEVWTIEDTDWTIEGTAMLIMGNGTGLCVVKAHVDFSPNATHRPMARSLAKYAVKNKYHKKVSNAVHNGKPVKFSGGIGVALVDRHGLGLNSGYRYSFKVDELQTEIEKTAIKVAE